jgi:hypothetical protein
MHQDSSRKRKKPDRQGEAVDPDAELATLMPTAEVTDATRFYKKAKTYPTDAMDRTNALLAELTRDYESNKAASRRSNATAKAKAEKTTKKAAKIAANPANKRKNKLKQQHHQKPSKKTSSKRSKKHEKPVHQGQYATPAGNSHNQNNRKSKKNSKKQRKNNHSKASKKR